MLRVRIDGSAAWCDRRLLARIHRYTLDRLRKEIEPVTAAQFLHFLACWQHVDPAHKLEGPRGVAAVVEQLAGFEASAPAWEGSILPARVRGYKREWLDQLTLSGEVTWGRLWGAGLATPRRTPISLVLRHDLEAWAGLAATHRSAGAARGRAAPCSTRCPRGARCSRRSWRAATRLPAVSVEIALGELVALGRATCDSYGGLRWLLVPASRRRAANLSAGRWSVLHVEPAAELEPRRVRGPAAPAAAPASCSARPWPASACPCRGATSCAPAARWRRGATSAAGGSSPGSTASSTRFRTRSRSSARCAARSRPPAGRISPSARAIPLDIPLTPAPPPRVVVEPHRSRRLPVRDLVGPVSARAPARPAACVFHHSRARSGVHRRGSPVASSARASSRALAGRRAGSFSRQARMSSSSAGGTAIAPRREGGTGGVVHVVEGELHRRRAFEDPLARHQPVGDAAEAVDVHAPVDRPLAEDDLGREVGGRAGDRALAAERGARSGHPPSSTSRGRSRAPSGSRAGGRGGRRRGWPA